MDSNTTQQTPTNEESLNSVANIAATLVAEEKDKEKRQLNIIDYNIDESSATSGAERKSEDIAKVSKVFQEVLKVPCSITRAFLVGKKKERKASSPESVCSVSWRKDQHITKQAKVEEYKQFR